MSTTPAFNTQVKSINDIGSGLFVFEEAKVNGPNTETVEALLTVPVVVLPVVPPLPRSFHVVPFHPATRKLERSLIPPEVLAQLNVTATFDDPATLFNIQYSVEPT